MYIHVTRTYKYNICSFKHKSIKRNGMRFTAISIAYHINVVKNIKEFYTSKNKHTNAYVQVCKYMISYGHTIFHILLKTLISHMKSI